MQAGRICATDSDGTDGLDRGDVPLTLQHTLLQGRPVVLQPGMAQAPVSTDVSAAMGYKGLARWSGASNDTTLLRQLPPPSVSHAVATECWLTPQVG